MSIIQSGETWFLLLQVCVVLPNVVLICVYIVRLPLYVVIRYFDILVCQYVMHPLKVNITEISAVFVQN